MKKQKIENFEDNLKKAKEIVQKLEIGDCSLDDMLNLYEEGIDCLKNCNKKLNEFEEKIKVIKKDIDGNLKYDDLK